MDSIKGWRASLLLILTPRVSKLESCLSQWWEMALAGAFFPLGNLCMSQEICLPPENSSFPTYCVKGFGVSFKVPPSIVPWQSAEWGHRTHSSTGTSVSHRARCCSSTDEHIDTFTNIFPLCIFFWPEAGERDLLIINLEHLIGLLWEGHCLLRQNNHGISRHDGKGEKWFIISQIILPSVSEMDGGF